MPREQLVYAVMPDAERIAQDLIATTHPHLADAHILWLSSTGKVKCAPKVFNVHDRFLNSLLAGAAEPDPTEGYDLECVINALDWADMGRRRVQAAAVDHMLSHIERVESDNADSTLTWRIRKHDVQEFSGVVERHGLWNTDLSDFGNAIPKQLGFLDGDVVAATVTAEPDPEPEPEDPDREPGDGDRDGGPLLYEDVRQAIAAGSRRRSAAAE